MYKNGPPIMSQSVRPYYFCRICFCLLTIDLQIIVSELIMWHIRTKCGWDLRAIFLLTPRTPLFACFLKTHAPMSKLWNYIRHPTNLPYSLCTQSVFTAVQLVVCLLCEACLCKHVNGSPGSLWVLSDVEWQLEQSRELQD